MLSPSYFRDLNDHRHYRILVLCRVQAALGKARSTLGKGFAECRTRQRALGKEFFVECHLSGTRQSLCRVPCQHSAKLTSTVIYRFLCRVLTWQALGKEFLIFFLKKNICRVPLWQALGKVIFFETIFAECWHSANLLSLCRVPVSTRQSCCAGKNFPSFAECLHSANLDKFFFSVFFTFHPCNITYIQHKSIHKFIRNKSIHPSQVHPYKSITSPT